MEDYNMTQAEKAAKSGLKTEETEEPRIGVFVCR